MPRHGLHPHFAWGPVHRASFGLIYGSILVLSLLMAMDEARNGAFEAALVLFGSVLAVTLAKIFAEVLSHGMETGERILTAKAFGAAWRTAIRPCWSPMYRRRSLSRPGWAWFSVETATARLRKRSA